MNKMAFIWILLSGVALSGQTFNIDSLIQQVDAVSGQVAKQMLTNDFVERAQSVGVPIIQGNQVIFIYRGNPGYVSLGGDHNNWQASFKKPLKHIDSTNFYYQIENFKSHARFEYGYLVDDFWLRDVENPKKGARLSELAMPDYVYPWETAQIDSTNKGQLISSQLHYFAEGLDKEYNVTAYLPYGYDTQAGIKYPVVYFQDGSLYLRYANAKNIFDNLIHFKVIDPVIAIFVDPYSRSEEYLASQKDSYAEFFATRLVSYIDSMYTTDTRAEKRLVAGPSYGGNISAYISYKYAHVFANCGLHSAAFRPTFDVYYLITKGEKKDVNYFAVWGSYEYPIYVDMRAFRSEVTDLGYNFSGQEYPEGHNIGFWKAHIQGYGQSFFSLYRNC
jgi:enterochelin esterase family protein